MDPLKPLYDFTKIVSDSGWYHLSAVIATLLWYITTPSFAFFLANLNE